MENKSRDFFTIDLLHIIKYLWKRVWIIIIFVRLIMTILIHFSRFPQSACHYPAVRRW